MITLQQHQSAAGINPDGGRIEYLRLKGIELLTTATRGDGKKGSTHPCSPIFGPETTTHFGLAQHGPVRTTMMNIDEETETTAKLTATVEQANYPHGLHIEQQFTLTETSFTIITTHTNTGNDALPVNFGEHFYWNTPARWDTLMLNNQLIDKEVKANGTAPLNGTNTIQIPEMPPITLEQEGMPVAVIWSYKHRDNTYDTAYVCIEPAEGNPSENYFGIPSSLILPNSSRSTRLVIRM